MSEEVSKNISETLFEKNKQAKETSHLIRYMPSSMEILERRRAETPSSWYRNLLRLQWAWQGIDLSSWKRHLPKLRLLITQER